MSIRSSLSVSFLVQSVMVGLHFTSQTHQTALFPFPFLPTSKPMYDTIWRQFSYDINLRATLTTILSIRGVTIPIYLVSSTTDSIRWHVVLFKPVPIPTSDPKSEFLCQLSVSCKEPTDSPETPRTPGISPMPPSSHITHIAIVPVLWPSTWSRNSITSEQNILVAACQLKSSRVFHSNITQRNHKISTHSCGLSSRNFFVLPVESAHLMLSVVPYSPYVLTWLSYLVIYQPYPWSCRWRVTTVFLHATCAKSQDFEPLISQGQHIMFPWISLLIQLSKGTTLANKWSTIHMTFLCAHTTGCLPKLLRSMMLLQMPPLTDSQNSMASRALLSSLMSILSSFLPRFHMTSCTLSGKTLSKI